MKRVLSLVLALVMVLGTMPMAFAADETAGEMLQAAGFVAGDENGNLMEDQSLTRAELAVLVAELNGVKENAKTYAIAPEFADVTADDWFGPYVAYAAKEGWFKGDTEGNFNPTATVSDQTMATVMLRALGYEPAWETAVSEAKAMGLPVGAADAAMMTRGEAFATMWGVVNTPKKDSDVALGVELGKIEPAQEEVTELVAELDGSNIKVKGNTLVDVDFKGSPDPVAMGEVANYTIVEKADTTKEIAVLSAHVHDGDDVFLETESLTAGKAYTVIVGDSKANFSGIAKDSDAPEVDSVKGTDTGEITVTFDDDEAYVDRATAEDVANYTLSGEGTIVKAELDEACIEVTLTVEGMTSSKSQKLTIENIMSTDGVVMSKEIKSFGPDFDKTAPKIEDDDYVEASEKNNTEVLVVFKDDHGVDKETAEDVSNYSIDGLEIISAKATYMDDNYDDYYNKVILTTSEQKSSKKYTLEVKYMVDGSTSANATTKVLKEDFRGGDEDEDAPKVDSVEHRNLTEIEVTFEEANALDVATALDAGNYEFEDDELEVIDVRFDDIDDNGNSYSYGVTGLAKVVNPTNKLSEYEVADDADLITVILTVTEMEIDENYKLLINNIADNYGNVMDDEEKETVDVEKEVTTYSTITGIDANDLESIRVYFEHRLDEDSAEDMTNYDIDGNIGNIKRAVYRDSDKSVALTVPKLTLAKTYEITVNNVENLWGYAAEDVTYSFIAANDKEDDTQPEVDDADYEYKGELIIEFDEPMSAKVGSAQVKVQKGTETPIVLDLVDTREDDKVLVFDAQAGEDENEVALDLELKTEYDIVEFVNVTDLAGNYPDYTDGDEDFKTENDNFMSSDNDDAVEADSSSQETGNTIEVTFSRPIQFGRVNAAGDTITTPGTFVETGDGTKAKPATVVYIPFDTDDKDKDNNDSYGFTMEITGDDDDKILFTKASGAFPDDAVELRFDFTRMSIDDDGATPVDSDDDVIVLDILGRTSRTGQKLFTDKVDNEDDTDPELEDVVAVDNKTLMLYFSEKLSSTGSYNIFFEDEDDDDELVEYDSNELTAEFDDDDLANIVKITLDKDGSTEFKAQEYELYFDSVPRDLSGNKVDDYQDKDDTFTFEGSSKTKAIDMVAAKVEGATSVKVINDADDFVSGDSAIIVITGQDDELVYAKASSSDEELEIDIPLYYALLNEDEADVAVTYSFEVILKTSELDDIDNDDSDAIVVADYDKAEKDYTTQTFTGSIDESRVKAIADSTEYTTTAGTFIEFECGDLDVDDADYAFVLTKQPVWNYDTMTYGATEVEIDLVVDTTIIKDGDTISVLIPTSAYTAGANYKVAAFPKEDGKLIGSVKYITEAIKAPN